MGLAPTHLLAFIFPILVPSPITVSWHRKLASPSAHTSPTPGFLPGPGTPSVCVFIVLGRPLFSLSILHDHPLLTNLLLSLYFHFLSDQGQ